MKKFMLIVAAGLALVACNKEKKDATTTTEDSTAMVVEAPVVAEPKVFNYATADGKQHFEMTVTDDTYDNITLKDVEGNVVYEMKTAVSADGAKWESEEGYYFWTKGNTFYFGKDDKQLCEGALVEEAPAEEAAVVTE
ncbi:MAG: MliC family protein [Porphyromonas sp.]|uniref:MliC family protein n=1 Tax=Porphyromonas sp. TaxID=1924944 RepID=UPI002A75A374|nr:MliC family protein [Porphyromonas sp.]MDD6928523.1 MliC family protein [Bacteroidales bacterium]MDY3111184.1 MliC family protein [Porphyromonas sp.]MDY4246560.1 MliC family protein [Porphyromonas sp.]